MFPAAALFYLGTCDTSNPTSAVILLVIAVSGGVFIQCGANMNQLDIAPNLAGILMGITNGIGNMSGLLAPLAVQILVTNEVSET